MPEQRDEQARLVAQLRQAELRADAFREAWIELRSDVPRAGLFNAWSDAVAQASRQAALVGRRYRVRLEPNNLWWTIQETTTRLGWWEPMRADAFAEQSNRPGMRPGGDA